MGRCSLRAGSLIGDLSLMAIGALALLLSAKRNADRRGARLGRRQSHRCNFNIAETQWAV